MKALGIGGKVGSWIFNFLTQRTQQISANGAISPPSQVLSGVPQGTVLGPILFVIMISDLDKSLTKSFASLFADDSRISAKIDNPNDVLHFQKELDNIIYPWANNNKAVFNGDKFEHIHFGKKLTNNDCQYQDPKNQLISTKSVIKDLGILISTSLQWSPHINKVIADCRRQAAWILRTFTKRDIATMRTLWTSLIRPISDYCSPLWAPHPNNYGNIDRLEGILRNFSKHVESIQHLDYQDRLTSMNLSSMQRRHERYKIIYIYKIKEGLVPNLTNDPLNPEQSFSLKFTYNPRSGYRCTTPSPVLYHNKAELQRRSSFSLTGSNLWNCLPRCINTISNVSVETFKTHLDKFLNVFPDTPRCVSNGQYYDSITGRSSNSIWHMSQLPSIKQKIQAFERDWALSCVSKGGPRRGNPPP